MLDDDEEEEDPLLLGLEADEEEVPPEEDEDEAPKLSCSTVPPVGEVTVQVGIVRPDLTDGRRGRGEEGLVISDKGAEETGEPDCDARVPFELKSPPAVDMA